MSETHSSSTALPIAYVTLRILIIVNWFMCAVVLALLFLVPNREWILSALDLSPSSDADRVVMGLRCIAGVGLVMVPLYYMVLKRLLAIIDTVRAGDPFVAVNAQRLHAIAWAMLALQGLGVMMGAIAKAISTPAHPIDIDAGFSTGGWLAVLLTFVLARVFAHGTAMRDDLQGTV